MRATRVDGGGEASGAERGEVEKCGGGRAVDFLRRAVDFSSGTLFARSFPTAHVEMRAWCNRSLHQRQVGSTLRRKGTQIGRKYFAQLIEGGDSVEPKIGRLVLVRHGQSEWNVTDPTRGLTARFVSYCKFHVIMACAVFVTFIHRN